MATPQTPTTMGFLSPKFTLESIMEAMGQGNDFSLILEQDYLPNSVCNPASTPFDFLLTDRDLFVMIPGPRNWPPHFIQSGRPLKER